MDHIRNSLNLGSSVVQSTYNGAREGTKSVGKGIQTTLDVFIPGSKPSTPDINTNIDGYKEINHEQAAGMLGYFTQKMESEGFPWRIYKPKKEGSIKNKAIGDFEALQRLRKGKPVIMQPMRVIGIGFSPHQFKGKDIHGKEANGAVSVKTGGMDVKYGEPIQISNYAELKFLHDVYNPAIEVDPSKDPALKVAARQLAYFTKGTMGGQYPWKMFKPYESTGEKIGSLTAGALKQAAKTAGFGALAASIFSIPAIALGSTVGGPIGVAAGALIGAAIGIHQGIKARRQGKEINAMEALSRLDKGKPVTFQEMKKREIGLSIPFPIGIQLGSLSFYGQNGEGSTINNFEEFNLFNKIQEQK